MSKLSYCTDKFSIIIIIFTERGKVCRTILHFQIRIGYSGKIKNVNPSIDENGQIEVCAVLDGASSLINGMNVKVTVDKVLDSRLVVPKSAVVVRDNLNVLFRYNNGRADWVYVNILAANSDSYAIEANAARGAELSVGEQIIVSGNLNLADGSIVSLKQ